MLIFHMWDTLMCSRFHVHQKVSEGTSCRLSVDMGAFVGQVKSLEQSSQVAGLAVFEAIVELGWDRNEKLLFSVQFLSCHNNAYYSAGLFPILVSLL